LQFARNRTANSQIGYDNPAFLIFQNTFYLNQNMHHKIVATTRGE